MRRRAGEIGHTATAISWADIAAHGAGGTRRSRETLEEGEQRRVHTQREERGPEKESEIQADEEKSRHPGVQGLRHIPGQEETGRSDTMETVTPQTSAPRQAAEIQMECEGVGRRKRQTRLDIGHQSHNKSNMRKTNLMWRKRGVGKNRWKLRYGLQWTPQHHRRRRLHCCTTHQAWASKKTEVGKERIVIM